MADHEIMRFGVSSIKLAKPLRTVDGSLKFDGYTFDLRKSTVVAVKLLVPSSLIMRRLTISATYLGTTISLAHTPKSQSFL